jgi:hypothetical protein
LNPIECRSDGVAIDWEVPPDEVQETDIDDDAEIQFVRREMVELDNSTEAGADLMQDPPVNDGVARASAEAAPMQFTGLMSEIEAEGVCFYRSYLISF